MTTNTQRIPADVEALVDAYGSAERNYARASDYMREMGDEHRVDHRAALLDRIAELIAPRGEWQPIETLAESEELILACRASDGAQMIWRTSILLRNLRGPTPYDLSFKATHWMPLPPPPAGPMVRP